MLEITIELVRSMDGSRKVLGTGQIMNVGTGSQSSGEYYADFRGANGARLRHCTIRGFPRTRLLSWDLLARGLALAFGGRNGISLKEGG